MTAMNFVTVFYIPHEMLDSKVDDVDRKDWDSFLYKRKRCWGFFEKESDAEKCIKENWTDIYECGYYNLAIIESMSEGICNHNKNIRWFTVAPILNHDRCIEDYDIKELDETPKRFTSYIGFSLG